MNSHILMYLGFAIAMLAMLSIRRYGYAIIFFAALVETYARYRYPFHGIMRDYLLRDGYAAAEKTDFQVRLLIGCAGAGVILLLLLAPMVRRMTWGPRLMLAGGLTIAAMLGVELISLHGIDSLIYEPVATVAPCAIVYFIGAGLAAGGALVERRRQAGRSPVA